MGLGDQHQWLRSTPIAHRGLHDLRDGRPENSLGAFEAACRLGYPIELDVRATADGRAVVLHDEELYRLTGVHGRCGEMEAAKVTAARLQGTDQRIPLLDEALDLVGGRVPILVDIKSDNGGRGGLEAVVVEAVRRYRGEVALQAFNPLSVWRVRASGRPTGQVAGYLRSAPPPLRAVGRSLVLNVITRPRFLSYELAALPSRPVTLWRRLGLPVIAWTVHDEREEGRARQLADNFMFAGYDPRGGEA